MNEQNYQTLQDQINVLSQELDEIRNLVSLQTLTHASQMTEQRAEYIKLHYDSESDEYKTAKRQSSRALENFREGLKEYQNKYFRPWV